MLLDTHVLVWLDEGSDKLGKQARHAIERAFEDDALAVCAISFGSWRCCSNGGRIDLPPLEPWREELLDMGLREVAVDGKIGLAAAGLHDFHPDPADRLIVATAIAPRCHARDSRCAHSRLAGRACARGRQALTAVLS